MTQQYETVRADQVKVGDYVVNLGAVTWLGPSHLGKRVLVEIGTERAADYRPESPVLIHERPKWTVQDRGACPTAGGRFKVLHGDTVMAYFREASDATLYIASKTSSA